MKTSEKTLVATTINRTTVPSAEDLGFTCSSVMSKEAYIASEHQKNNRKMVKRSLIVNGLGLGSFVITKALTAIGDKTGRRGYYAAAAVIGGIGTIGTLVANNKVIDDGMSEFSRIEGMKYGLPDYVRRWEQSDVDECHEIATVKRELEHDPEKDGPMSVYELRLNRAERVGDILDEAGIEHDINDIVDLLERGDYGVIRALVDSAKAIIENPHPAVNKAVVEGTEKPLDFSAYAPPMSEVEREERIDNDGQDGHTEIQP